MKEKRKMNLQSHTIKRHVASPVRSSYWGKPPRCAHRNIGWEGETGVFVTPLAYRAVL